MLPPPLSLPDVPCTGGGKPDLEDRRVVKDDAECPVKIGIGVEVLRWLKGRLFHCQLFDPFYRQDPDTIVFRYPDKEVQPTVPLEVAEWLEPEVPD